MPPEQLMAEGGAVAHPVPEELADRLLARIETDVTALAADLSGRLDLDGDAWLALCGHIRTVRLQGDALSRLLADPATIRRIVASRQALAAALRAAAAGATPFPPSVRQAFGVLGGAQEEALRSAVRAGRLRDAAGLAFNGDLIESAVGATVPMPFETSIGTSRRWSGRSAPAATPIAGVADPPSIIVSNGYELWRAASFATLEPETIVWVEQDFGAGDILYDVGANIGIVTLLAARAPGSRVVAFEPEPANHARLQENIRLNGRDNVIALPLALASKGGLASFRLRDAAPGASAPFPLAEGEGTRLACMQERLDALHGLPPPTHLKIDVDGGQRDVLEGGRATLAGATLRHILIEICEDELGDVDALLGASGFARVAVHFPPSPAGRAVGNVRYRRAG